MLTNHSTTTTSDNGPQTIEVDNQFYDDLYRRRGSRSRRDRPASKREQILRRFEEIQVSLIRYRGDRDLDQDTKVLIVRLADIELPNNLAEITTWIAQAEQLLAWVQSHVSSCRANRQARQEAAYLKERVDSVLEFYVQIEEGDFHRLARMYDNVQELFPTGLIPDEVYQAVLAARRELQAEQRHERMVEVWLDWAERFAHGDMVIRQEISLQKGDGRYGHRWGLDPDQRRAWRQQRAKVRGRKW